MSLSPITHPPAASTEVAPTSVEPSTVAPTMTMDPSSAISSAPAGSSPPLPLADIHLPDHPVWGLSLQGYVVIALIGAVLLLVMAYVLHAKRKNRLKHLALTKLNALDKAATHDIALLLKQAVLSHYPRKQVASLYGIAWWNFVEQQLPNKKQSNVRFVSNANQLEAALYGNQPLTNSEQQRFADDVRYWLTHALPIKNRQKGVKHA